MTVTKRRGHGEGGIRHRSDGRWEGSIASGQPFADERQTVEQWLDHWLDNVLPGTVKATTAANYANLARGHLIPVTRHAR
jgi:hypothetical protein